jgi:hypothetical protein
VLAPSGELGEDDEWDELSKDPSAGGTLSQAHVLHAKGGGLGQQPLCLGYPCATLPFVSDEERTGRYAGAAYFTID